MALNDTKRRSARRLYLHTDMTRKEIAETVHVTEKTLRRWIEKYGWDQLKEAESITRRQLLNDAYKQLKRINEHIETNLDGIPNKEMSDAKAVIRKEIEAISDSPLHIYIEVAEELIGYVQSHRPKELQSVAALVNDFIEAKAKEKNISV